MTSSTSPSLTVFRALQELRAASSSSSSSPPDIPIRDLRSLCSHADSRIRASAVRALRVGGVPMHGEALNRARVHMAVARSLERADIKYMDERMEALKLIRSMCATMPETVPRTLIRGLVALATHRDDPLKEFALELLRTFMLVNTRAVSECGGIAALVSAVTDVTVPHLWDTIMLTLLHVCNIPETRMWLRPSLDFAPIFAPFTSVDPNSESPERRAIRKASQRAIVTMMSTWTGLFLLASDPQGLRALVQVLVQPVSASVRRDVLETILEVFNSINPLRAPSFGSAHTGGVRFVSQNVVVNATTTPTPDDAADADLYYGNEPYMSEYWGVGPGAAGSKELAAGGFHTERVPGTHAHQHSIIDNYLVMVLMAFVQCGLVEALVELSVSTSAPMSRIATRLLSFVSRFSARLLPGTVSRRLLSQSKLVRSAVEAARVGDVSDRARAQRASHVISLLSHIVGEGYDTALATLLARSTFEDGIALASELCLIGSAERAQLNLGVFPRSIVVSTPSIVDTLVAAAKSAGQQGSSTPMASHAALDSQHQRLGGSSGGGGSGIKPVRRSMNVFTSFVRRNSGSKKDLANSQRSTEGGNNNVSKQELATSEATLGAPLVANRGHRRLVQQLVLTDATRNVVADPDELKRMLDRSRILIKAERREWRGWDWAVIEELLSGPCQNATLCGEILSKTKFFKRLCAFYSALPDGGFANVSWEPDSICFTNVGSLMIRCLLDANDSFSFLRDDRRGRIAGQIAEALAMELRHAEEEAAGAASQDTTNNMSSSGGLMMTNDDFRDHNDMYGGGDEEDHSSLPRLFTVDACNNTMVRDFFQLMGVFSGHERGIVLLTDAHLFDTLNRLALHRNKEYLLRLVITHLDYGSQHQHCRNWLQLLVMDKFISTDLRRFCVGFFRALLRSLQLRGGDDDDVPLWILRVLFAQLRFDDIKDDALSVLIEATHYPMFLNMMVKNITTELKPYRGMLESPAARPLLLKLLETEDGVQRVKAEGWLDKIMNEWSQGGYMNYVKNVEKSLVAQLTLKKNSTTSGTIPIPVRAHEASAMSEPGFAASELNWLYRLPWRVDMWAESPVAGRVYIPSDSFVDCSRLRPEARNLTRHADVCVTAVPPFSGKKKRLRSFMVPEDATIYASLTLGDAFVDKRGRMHREPRAGGGFPTMDMPMDHSESFGRASSKKRFTRRTSAGSDENQQGGGRSGGGGGGTGTDRRMDHHHQHEQHDVEIPFTDSNYWVTCVPQARREGVEAINNKLAMASTTHVVRVCPDNAAATFEFNTLPVLSSSKVQATYGSVGTHLSTVTRPPEGSVWSFVETAGKTSSSTTTDQKRHNALSNDGKDPTAAGTVGGGGGTDHEAEIRVVNPLLLKKRATSAGPESSQPPLTTTTPTPPSQQPSAESLPPLLSMSQIHFFLELVPHRYASPSIPVHLLGALAQTQAGAAVISSYNLISLFGAKLRDESASLLDRRASLWSLGHVGASEPGFRLLNENLIAVIHQIACGSSCLSLRGTAMYSLGLLSRCASGRDVLAKLGWAYLDARTHPFATLAVPAHVNIFNIPRMNFNVPAWTGLAASLDGVSGMDKSQQKKNMGQSQLLTNGRHEKAADPEVAKKILQCVSDLSNHIAQKEAHQELLRIKDRSPAMFGDPHVFLGVHELMAKYNYTLSVRQFLMGVFNSRLVGDPDGVWNVVDKEPYC